MKLKPKQIKQRLEQLKSERSTFETHWQELGDYILPNKSDFQRTYTDGQKRNTYLFDSTSLQACELLAGALHGMLTNPASLFFELSTGEEALDQLDEVRFFLQNTTRKLHNIINNSNFQTEIHEVYLDLACFGTAAMVIEEDQETVVRFKSEHIKGIYVAENNRGMIDEIYRCFKWTAKQVLQEFGEEKMPKKILEAYKNNSSEEFEIVHAIYPELDNPNAILKYNSQYVWPAEEFEFSFGGFRELSIVVPRWTKTSGEVYGRSPGMNALPDVKMVNEVMKTMIKAAQKAVDPPLMVPDDGFVMPVITKPGGLNYYRSGSSDRIETFANDARIDFGYQILNEMRTRIRDCFFIDQLQLNQGPQMTATEVNQRTEEKMRLLGPMLGRQQSELLKPLIDRLMEIMLRNEIINKADIPQVLSGRSLDVRYSSLIAKAQRTGESQNVLRAVQAIAPFANADPSVLDNFDGDQAVRYFMGVYGIPQEIRRTQKEVDQIRSDRAEAQQQAASQVQQSGQLDNAQKMAEIASMAKQA